MPLHPSSLCSRSHPPPFPSTGALGCRYVCAFVIGKSIREASPMLVMAKALMNQSMTIDAVDGFVGSQGCSRPSPQRVGQGMVGDRAVGRRHDIAGWSVVLQR